MGLPTRDLATGVMKTDDVSAALQLISRLGLTVEDLAGGLVVGTPIPTFRDFITRLRAALPVTTVRNYGTYWRIIEDNWGERLLDEPTATEIDQMVKEHRCCAVVRANSRGGRGAAANMVSAFRCLYRHAERDGLIHPSENPASKVDRPRPLPSPRHALTFEQVQDIGRVASTTGNDGELDALIVRLHIETACRRGGVLALTLNDLDREDCLVQLREKGETTRWQPVSPLLMSKLIEHVDKRGGEHTQQVLRYRDGRPVGRRRYDYLTERIREHLPWAAKLQVSAHWIRHTTLTFVEREFGIAIARAFAGHTDKAGNGAIFTYTRAGLIEVAEALTALTGQPHPLARTVRDPLAPRALDLRR
ncbi:Integrase [Nocardia ninae]